MNRWNTDVDLKAFLGIIINMELIPLPDITTYHSSKWEDKIPFFGDVFAKDDFLNIFWSLHFNHADGMAAISKDQRIALIVEHIKEKCKLFYTTSDFVAVDESKIS